MLAGFFSWTPPGFVFFRERALLRDQRVQFLLAWLLWGLVFFSVSVNKLPGHVLPLLPALAALTGIQLDRLSTNPISLVGQDGILPRLGKSPGGRVNHPPQVDNLPHKLSSGFLAVCGAWI